MMKALEMKPRNEASVQDYLVDFFILAGALHGSKISTSEAFSLEQLIENLNWIEQNQNLWSHSKPQQKATWITFDRVE
ncbi:hypothetical protein FGO68_gene1336 [Halteria grandinella]|uniref:Uncharacterized protein n=1 Tax=Halteria grandinella TaxID=5974 RepID=A0A8J8P0K5_HALGN|nr:hypothetical protein FGO68_gene1336 [Halteria grandinella]